MTAVPGRIMFQLKSDELTVSWTLLENFTDEHLRTAGRLAVDAMIRERDRRQKRDLG